MIGKLVCMLSRTKHISPDNSSWLYSLAWRRWVWNETTNSWSQSSGIIKKQLKTNLVGGFNHLEKWWSSSMGRIWKDDVHSYEMENNPNVWNHQPDIEYWRMWKHRLPRNAKMISSWSLSFHGHLQCKSLCLRGKLWLNPKLSHFYRLVI